MDTLRYKWIQKDTNGQKRLTGNLLAGFLFSCNSKQESKKAIDEVETSKITNNDTSHADKQIVDTSKTGIIEKNLQVLSLLNEHITINIVLLILRELGKKKVFFRR